MKTDTVHCTYLEGILYRHSEANNAMSAMSHPADQRAGPRIARGRTQTASCGRCRRAAWQRSGALHPGAAAVIFERMAVSPKGDGPAGGPDRQVDRMRQKTCPQVQSADLSLHALRRGPNREAMEGALHPFANPAIRSASLAPAHPVMAPASAFTTKDESRCPAPSAPRTSLPPPHGRTSAAACGRAGGLPACDRPEPDFVSGRPVGCRPAPESVITRWGSHLTLAALSAGGGHPQGRNVQQWGCFSSLWCPIEYRRGIPHGGGW